MSGDAETPVTRPAWSVAWTLLLAVSALVVSFADIVLLREATGFLTSGFNSVSIGSAPEILAFIAAALVMDVALILGSWAIVVPVAKRLPLSSLQCFAIAGMVGVGVPIALSAAQHNVYAVAGNMINLALLNRLGASTWLSMAFEAFDQGQLVYVVAVPLLVLAVVWFTGVLGRFERSHGLPLHWFRPPPSRRLWLAVVPLVSVGIALLIASSPLLSRLRYGLERKPSGAFLLAVIHTLGDVDRDGFDAFTEPRDTAPWNAAIHPYALDHPGNGIDEDGIAGDLAAVRELRESPPPAPAAPGTKPHVLLIYLESFRADLIHAEIDGRPVTHFLNRLAAEGAMSGQVYVHSPWTLPSRSQLFSGRLLSEPGQSTLIDDFKSRGYAVAHFSGQDESFGASDGILGVERADVFYDARQDVERRTSRSTAPVSLQVSWKTVLDRVKDYLGEADLDRPFFLYVNIVDTHFPYYHDELDDILGVAPLRRAEIRSRNAQRVVRAYANTAANVDRAAEELVGAWRARIGDADHAILVLADHGESFYEAGALGHGLSLTVEESRVPLILWGIGGDWPEPLGPTDIRGLLWRNLMLERGAEPPRARFAPVADRSVLQFAPGLGRPSVIALRRADGAFLYDFAANRFERIDADGARTTLDPARHDEVFRELVWSWETLKLANHEARVRREAGRDSP